MSSECGVTVVDQALAVTDAGCAGGYHARVLAAEVRRLRVELGRNRTETTMRDRIGWHLAEAQRLAVGARLFADSALPAPPRVVSEEKRHKLKLGAAAREGAAAGHAFRAAELAYDAGLSEGGQRCT